MAFRHVQNTKESKQTLQQTAQCSFSKRLFSKQFGLFLFKKKQGNRNFREYFSTQFSVCSSVAASLVSWLWRTCGGERQAPITKINRLFIADVLFVLGYGDYLVALCVIVKYMHVFYDHRFIKLCERLPHTRTLLLRFGHH